MFHCASVAVTHRRRMPCLTTTWEGHRRAAQTSPMAMPPSNACSARRPDVQHWPRCLVGCTDVDTNTTTCWRMAHADCALVLLSCYLVPSRCRSFRSFRSCAHPTEGVSGRTDLFEYIPPPNLIPTDAQKSKTPCE